MYFNLLMIFFPLLEYLFFFCVVLLLLGLGDTMWCWGSNQGHLCEKQVSGLLIVLTLQPWLVILDKLYNLGFLGVSKEHLYGTNVFYLWLSVHQSFCVNHLRPKSERKGAPFTLKPFRSEVWSDGYARKVHTGEPGLLIPGTLESPLTCCHPDNFC